MLPILAIALLLGPACRGTRIASQERTHVATSLRHGTRFVAATSTEVRPIEVVVMGHGRDVTLVIGAIHGDEPGGDALAEGLIRHLEEHPALLDGRRVVLVPIANPDGVIRSTRHNARGVDLNRDFPAANQRREGAPTQPESRLITALVDAYTPSRILTLHAPLRCVDYDGPAEALAKRVADACDLPVKKLGARPGSLGSWAGVDREIPVITFELPGGMQGVSAEDLWSRYGRAMVAALGTRPRHP